MIDYYFMNGVVVIVVEDLHERITRTETIVERNAERIGKLETNNEILTRLTVVAEQQASLNNEFKQELKEFRGTLNQVNSNLTELTATQKQMQKDMKQIGERVTHIELKQEDQKIDVPNLFTKVIVGIFMIIPTLITAWLLIQLNLK